MIAFPFHRSYHRKAFHGISLFCDLSVTYGLFALKSPSVPTIKTEAGVRAAKLDPTGRQVDRRVEGARGLTLRISPAGRKTWSLRYRTADGEQRRHTLGTYPEVGLADARTAAQVALRAVAGGADPAKAKRDAKAAAKARKLSTVADLMGAYFEAAERGKHRTKAGRPKRASTLVDERSYSVRYIKPRLGARPIDEVTRAEVQRLIDDIEMRSPGAARITRNLIRQAYNFGIMQEAVDRNPALLISVARWNDRERVLSDDELQSIWTACRASHEINGLGVAQGTTLALQLALVTLQRGGEVCGIHGREIDRSGRLWIIPGERTKNHRTHVVPLSGLALDILDDAFALAMGQQSEKWTGYAFPSPHDHSKSITRRGLSRAMQRLCRNKAVNVADATPHDFRRTGSTNITSERIGIPRFIVSRVLNQVSDTGGAAAVTGIYDRNEYLPEKRRALDAWATLLGEIVEGKERAANVVRLGG